MLVANISGEGNAARVWAAGDGRFLVELIAEGKALTLAVTADELVAFTRSLARFCLPLEQIERASILSRVYVPPGDCPKAGPVAWPLTHGATIMVVSLAGAPATNPEGA